MIIDGELEAKKKHVSIGQVGTTKRIPSLPLKPPFDHVSWLHALPQIFWSPMCLQFNNLNNII